MTGAPRLRPATAADEPFLRSVYATARATELAGSGWPPAQQQAFLAQQFAAQTAGYRATHPAAVDRLVLVRDHPVGRLYLEVTDTEARVLDLALLPEHRGAGTGTAVLRDLQAGAASAGIPVRLAVVRGNPAARLYARLGFRVVGGDGVRLELAWTRPSRADWTAAVGTNACLVGTTGSRPVELVGVRAGPPRQYTVLLSGPDPVAGGPTEQGTYRLELAGLGTLDVFLVPAGRRDGRLDWAAAFDERHDDRGGSRGAAVRG